MKSNNKLRVLVLVLVLALAAIPGTAQAGTYYMSDEVDDGASFHVRFDTTVTGTGGYGAGLDGYAKDWRTSGSGAMRLDCAWGVADTDAVWLYPSGQGYSQVLGVMYWSKSEQSVTEILHEYNSEDIAVGWENWYSTYMQQWAEGWVDTITGDWDLQATDGTYVYL